MYVLNDGIDDHWGHDLAVARVRHPEATALSLHCDGQHGCSRDRYADLIHWRWDSQELTRTQSCMDRLSRDTEDYIE